MPGLARLGRCAIGPLLENESESIQAISTAGIAEVVPEMDLANE